jgi:hypothetical protein
MRGTYSFTQKFDYLQINEQWFPQERVFQQALFGNLQGIRISNGWTILKGKLIKDIKVGLYFELGLDFKKPENACAGEKNTLECQV